jgi:hypothetical protein
MLPANGYDLTPSVDQADSQFRARFTVGGFAEVMSSRRNEIRLAFDGEQAVAVTEEVRPPVSLLDIGIPGVAVMKSRDRSARNPCSSR